MKRADGTSKARKAAILGSQLSLERTRGVLALLRGLAAWLGRSRTKKEDPPASNSPSKPGVSVAKKRRAPLQQSTKRTSNGRKTKG